MLNPKHSNTRAKKNRAGKHLAPKSRGRGHAHLRKFFLCLALVLCTVVFVSVNAASTKAAEWETVGKNNSAYTRVQNSYPGISGQTISAFPGIAGPVSLTMRLSANLSSYSSGDEMGEIREDVDEENQSIDDEGEIYVDGVTRVIIESNSTIGGAFYGVEGPMNLADKLRMNWTLYEINDQSDKAETDENADTGADNESLDYTIVEHFDVPQDYESNTGFKAFMSYKAITSTGSKQYAMQQEAWTDEQGFRRYGEYYMVALGTYYSSQCGETFLITLDSGISFKAITGDIKSNRDTDSMNQHHNGNIVEFIVDYDALSDECKTMGDMSYAGFEGRIASIEKIKERTDV